VAQTNSGFLADSLLGMTNLLDGFAAEEIDQLDDEDYYDHEFKHEGAALVEFVDHEAVELFGGLQFLLDQVFVVGDADF
jgi:hypothetical protein